MDISFVLFRIAQFYDFVWRRIAKFTNDFVILNLDASYLDKISSIPKEIFLLFSVSETAVFIFFILTTTTLHKLF